MDTWTRKQLEERNERIIRAVIGRAEKCCLGALALIAVTGSFASGDAYEDSDLDLLIVCDDGGASLARCFLIGEIGFDIYCQSWERLRGYAAYTAPYVSALLDAKIVYVRDAAAEQRFAEIADGLRAHLSGDLDAKDIENAEAHLRDAKAAFADLCLSEKQPLIDLGGILWHLEAAVYLLNHAYVRHGVRGIPEEIQTLASLPVSFCTLYERAYLAEDAASARLAAAELLRAVEVWVKEKRASVCEPTAASMDGIYQEAISNWGGKMRRAAREEDLYLSRMSAVSAAMYCREMEAAFGVHLEKAAALGAIADAEALDAAYRQMLAELSAVCVDSGAAVRRYEDVAAFEAAYLCECDETV